MKIIISHDVDHLYPSDHILRDLVFPKLWVRSTLELVTGHIQFQTWINRLLSISRKRLHQIPEIIEFDKKNNIPSVFFFGMDKMLGMSYEISSVIPWINFVIKSGFDAGLHGVEIDNIEKMEKEYIDFKTISGVNLFGIRTHYVRYNDTTFKKMAQLGYSFDTSEYKKKQVNLSIPYKIGNMWEFPLHIMDEYILKDKLVNAKNKTIDILTKSEKRGLKYLTFLFHDYKFNVKTYPDHVAYYDWFVNYCIIQHFEFVSYRQAIIELERNLRYNEL